MKKLSIIAVTLLVAGTVSSWAQSNIINTTSNEVAGFIVGPLPISFTGKLSNKGTVDSATLAAVTPSGGTLEFAEGFDVGALSTGQTFLVIGTSLGTSNIVTVVSGHTNTDVTVVGFTVLSAVDFVDPKGGSKSSVKFTSGWNEQNSGFGQAAGGTNIDFTTALTKVVSNSTLLISGTVSESKTTNVSAKVTGVWLDGVATISGSIKVEKSK